jgi:GGDEF domain-containing protein
LAVDCYRAAIKDFAHYSIDLDNEVRAYRGYLSDLAEQVGDGSPDRLAESRATLRNLLRGVRDRTEQHLAGLRAQFADTERALQEVMLALVSGENDHDERLRAALGVLRDLGNEPEVRARGSALLAVANEIDSSLSSLRQQHQLTVSQLKTEIGVLHKRIDAMDFASRPEKASDIRTRAEMEQYIRSEVKGGTCLVALKVRGLRMAHERFSREVGSELLGAFTKRMRNMLPPGTVAGRWSEEEFLAAVAMAKGEAMKLSGTLSNQLAGMYSCLKEGKTVRPSLQVSTGLVEVNAGDGVEEILRRVGSFLTT